MAVKLNDKYVTCSVNTDDPELNNLVKSRNTHDHTKTCFKKGCHCRFHFPKNPSEFTLIGKCFKTVYFF